MSARFKGLTVAFARDLHEDHTKAIRDAIMLIGEVASVSLSVDDGDDWMNRERVRNEMERLVLEVVRPKGKLG